MPTTDLAPIVDRLRHLDRSGLIQIRTELQKLLTASMPKGVLNRYIVPATVSSPLKKYDLVLVRCGRKRCNRCVEGGHGPYWYAHWHDEEGKRRSRYIGRELPADVRAAAAVVIEPPMPDDGPIETTAREKPIGRRVFPAPREA